MIHISSRPKPYFDSPSSFFCHHRISIDYQELFNENIRMSSNKCMTSFDQPSKCNNNYVLYVEIISNEGAHRGILFKMEIIIPKEYPFVAPRIFCGTKVAHPNIDYETGEVYLSMLKPNEWIPVLNLNFIIFAIELVIITPDVNCIPNNPYNREMIIIYRDDPQFFENIIYESVKKAQITLIQTGKMVDEDEEEKSKDVFIEKPNFKTIERKLSQIYVDENAIKPEGIVRSLKYDFDKGANPHEVLGQALQEVKNLNDMRSAKKRRRAEDDILINPFLKHVKISPT